MYQLPSLRLALGLGDQELEQRLRPALDASDDLMVAAQCLAADQVVQAVESRQVDAVLIAWSLHRLTDSVLEQLDRTGLPVVLLVPDPAEDRWAARQAPVLAVDADIATIHQALRDASRNERLTSRRRPTSEPVALKAADSPSHQPAVGTVVAIAGGAGSPGRTTVAISLATALGAVAPTVLVEADLCAPAIAAYLDLDPTRNVCTLAHAVRDSPTLWSAALADELQPLSRHSPSGVVLCGPPKREMRGSIAPGFLQRVCLELAARYRYVVVDSGPELLGVETAAANHRAVLGSAHQVLLVCAPDMVGLWHARTALEQLEHQVGLQRSNVSLVLNRHDRRFQHAPSEVEWHLGAPVAVVIPYDQAATQRAIADQRPLVVDASSRASRALLKLAEGVHHEGQVRLPVEDEPLSRWQRIVGRHRRASRAGPVLGANRSPARAASGTSSGQAW